MTTTAVVVLVVSVLVVWGGLALSIVNLLRSPADVGPEGPAPDEPAAGDRTD
jgi:hypothetical protein